MIYIVSRTYAQARTLAEQIGLHFSKFVFISSIQHLAGLDRPVVALWGDYQNRGDWSEIEEYLRACRATVLDLQDLEDGHRRVVDFWFDCLKAKDRAAITACHFPGYIQTVNNGAY